MAHSQLIKIKNGLKLPITGEPEQRIESSPTVRSVAVVNVDFPGVKPTMHIKVGDSVRLGQKLYTDKKNEAANFVAPGSGTVTAIHRGAKRALQSVVIGLDGADRFESFQAYPPGELSRLKREDIVKQLVDSGEWTALRTRPFSKVPSRDSVPRSIFVTAIDTHPLAADPLVIIDRHQHDFENGLKILGRLTEGNVFLCQAPNKTLPGAHFDFVHPVAFSGGHPAGLAGTHIHFLDPVGLNRTVWTIGYQDVIAFGKLFTTGKVFVDRYVALAGPVVRSPRLIQTRLGASTADLTMDGITEENVRVVSGSVFGGRHAKDDVAYLGRFHNQVSVLKEGTERVLLGWQMPGFDKFSVTNAFAGHTMPWKKFAFTTSKEGSDRAMVPIGLYEKVMPLDMEPTFLLKSLITQDTDEAQLLGCLELDEEDLALCTFVCPGKYVYGPMLRRVLDTIEKEG